MIYIQLCRLILTFSISFGLWLLISLFVFFLLIIVFSCTYIFVCTYLTTYSLFYICKMNCELMLTYDTPAYIFNVYKNQLSRQAGSRNLTGRKTLPTIWHTYMKLVTKYQIPFLNSCLEKCEYTNVCSMCIKINKISCLPT
jgi:hypothetical protein